MTIGPCSPGIRHDFGARVRCESDGEGNTLTYLCFAEGRYLRRLKRLCACLARNDSHLAQRTSRHSISRNSN